MSETLNLMLEAERRGILPPDRSALLNEARKRGLIPGGGPAAPQPSPGQMDQDLANTPRPVEEPFDPMQSAFSVQPTPAVPTGSTAERRDLMERGIRVGNAPIGARFREGFALDEKSGLERQGFKVTIDQRSGRTLYRKSAQEPWTTVSEPGLPTIGDAASLVGPAVREVPAAVGGAAGTIGGFMAGGPVGATAGGAFGSGLGAGMGEFGRLKIGKEMGVVPPDSDIQTPAVINALLALGFGALMSAGFSAKQAFMRRGVPDSLKHLKPEQLEAAYETAKAKVAGTGLEDTLRPSQAFAANKGTENIGDQLGAMERSTLRSGGSGRDPLAKNMREQMERLEGQTSRIQGEAPMLDPAQVGVNAQQAAQREVRGDLRSAVQSKGSAGAARAEATASQKVLEPAVQPDYVGEPIRQRITNAYEKAEEAAGQGYARVRAMPGAESGQALNTVAELKRSQDAINKILIPSLNEQDRQLVEPTLQRLVREVVVSDDGIPTRAARPEIDTSFTANRFSGVTLDELDATLRAIRREIRKVNTGVATADVQQLMKLENALQADRDIILGPQRAKALTDAEAGWRTLRDEFNRAPLIDRVLSRKSGGAEKVEDFQLGRLSLNPDNAKAIANVLKDDPEALEMMKRAMREKAREAAGITASGKVNPDALQAWLRKNDPMLSAVFSEQERKAMMNPVRMQREFAQREGAMNEVRKTIEQRYQRYGVERDFAGRIKDPASYVENIVSSGNTQLAQDSFRLLKRRDPTTAREMQAVARQMLAREITGGGERPTASGVQTLLGSPEKLRVYGEIIGPEIRDRLTKLAVALEVVSPEHIAAAVGDPAGSFRRIIQGLQRITMSPLSAASRRTTFLRELGEGEISDRIGRAIVDEKSFKAFIKQISEDKRGLARARAVGVGAVMGAGDGAAEAEPKIREYMNGR